MIELYVMGLTPGQSEIEMNDFVTLFRNWKFAAVLVGLLALMYFGSDYTNFLQFPPIDRSDYKTVAEEFVRRSGFVTKRVGKISQRILFLPFTINGLPLEHYLSRKLLKNS